MTTNQLTADEANSLTPRRRPALIRTSSMATAQEMMRSPIATDIHAHPHVRSEPPSPLPLTALASSAFSSPAAFSGAPHSDPTPLDGPLDGSTENLRSAFAREQHSDFSQSYPESQGRPRSIYTGASAYSASASDFSLPRLGLNGNALGSTYSTPALSESSLYPDSSSHELAVGPFTPTYATAPALLGHPGGLALDTSRFNPHNKDNATFLGSSQRNIHVQHFFPDNGEANIPVTVVATVSVKWAQSIGLHIPGQVTSLTASNHRITVSYGQEEVEPQITSTLDAAQSTYNLTITSLAPPFSATLWTSTRVPLSLQLAGTEGRTGMQSSEGPIGVGEFTYWLMSPRPTLKRLADPMDESADPKMTGLRRPASYPAISTALSAMDRSPYASASNSNLAGAVRLGAMRNGSIRGKGKVVRQRSDLNFSASPQVGSGLDSPGLESIASDFTFSARSDMNIGTPTLASARMESGGDLRSPTTASPMMTMSPRLSASSFSPVLPQLMRATQIPQAPEQSSPNGSSDGARASLQLHGELTDMAVGWTHDEYLSSRRLVQFWRRQEGTTIHATFRPILPEHYVPNSIVVSCIFREDENKCFITSVDTIYLLEALVASRFTIEEKNRIRRNLEGFRPATISKAKAEDPDVVRFFSLIMSFPAPKPRHIEKDVKVFAWDVLAPALKKIISKYSSADSVNFSGIPSDHNRVGSGSNSSNSNPSPSIRDARALNGDPNGMFGRSNMSASPQQHGNPGTSPERSLLGAVGQAPHYANFTGQPGLQHSQQGQWQQMQSANPSQQQQKADDMASLNEYLHVHPNEPAYSIHPGQQQQQPGSFASQFGAQSQYR